MNYAPKITIAMLQAKKLIYDVPDRHHFIKVLNQIIEEKCLSDNGQCSHYPADTSRVTVKGDNAGRYDENLLCVYCGQLIEPLITFVLKSKLPNPPGLG